MPVEFNKTNNPLLDNGKPKMFPRQRTRGEKRDESLETNILDAVSSEAV
jgi:hypothetical protein